MCALKRQSCEGSPSAARMIALTLCTLVQDYEIECPDTKTKFSLKTGEITDWYAHPSISTLKAHPRNIILPLTVTLQTSHKQPEHACRYPTNPVLRAITPKDTVRDMDIYPVKLTQDAIMVDVSGAATTKFQGAGRGGSDTSIDANNVFALQPRTYLEGSGPDGAHASLLCMRVFGHGMHDLQDRGIHAGAKAVPKWLMLQKL